LKLARHKTPKAGTPVFLIDRREPELIQTVAEWTARLNKVPAPPERPINVALNFPGPESARTIKRLDIMLSASLPQGRESKAFIRPGMVLGLWLSPKTLKDCSRTLHNRISWWLPPVIWPDEEAQWQRLAFESARNGARHFVLNAPWQTALFNDAASLNLTAGPFCNTANPAALAVLRSMGFTAAIVSPELSGPDILSLPGQSCLPLGIVMDGFWPAGISRYGRHAVKQDTVLTSPKGEPFWVRRYGGNTWVYPGWPLDLTPKRQELEQAGYVTFIHIREHLPEGLELRRTSLFNWDVGLL
jgi:putative protease